MCDPGIVFKMYMMACGCNLIFIIQLPHKLCMYREGGRDQMKERGRREGGYLLCVIALLNA